MPNQEAGLSYDHGMCRAVLHANPGSAARSPLASAASSTTSYVTPPLLCADGVRGEKEL